MTALEDVLRTHEIVEVTGGTATGARWRCACGTAELIPGTRGMAKRAGRRHVADAIREHHAAELRARGIDPAPATTGEAYRHPQSGRVCLRRAGAPGWWPVRWEDGLPNLSGGTVCFKPHPPAS